MPLREVTGSFPFPSFFFSSRRRHTRFDCDWSSDVCSSDLPIDIVFADRQGLVVHVRSNVGARRLAGAWRAFATIEIGRASCRERVYMSVVAGVWNKKMR